MNRCKHDPSFPCFRSRPQFAVRDGVPRLVFTCALVRLVSEQNSSHQLVKLGQVDSRGVTAAG